jgi:hypothetical protein
VNKSVNDIVIGFDGSSTSTNVNWSNDDINCTNIETRLSDQKITDLGSSFVNCSFQQDWELDIAAARAGEVNWFCLSFFGWFLGCGDISSCGCTEVS